MKLESLTHFFFWIFSTRNCRWIIFCWRHFNYIFKHSHFCFHYVFFFFWFSSYDSDVFAHEKNNNNNKRLNHRKVWCQQQWIEWTENERRHNENGMILGKAISWKYIDLMQSSFHVLYLMLVNKWRVGVSWE